MKHNYNINNTMNDNDKIMNIISKVFNATTLRLQCPLSRSLKRELRWEWQRTTQEERKMDTLGILTPHS